MSQGDLFYPLNHLSPRGYRSFLPLQLSRQSQILGLCDNELKSESLKRSRGGRVSVAALRQEPRGYLLLRLATGVGFCRKYFTRISPLAAGSTCGIVGLARQEWLESER